MAKNLVKGVLVAIVGPGLFMLGVYALLAASVGLAGQGVSGDCECEAPKVAGLGLSKWGLLAFGIGLLLVAFFAVRQVQRAR
jgi:hypothetical protein